eukprot:jgi/Tetstr1/444163/TSEL_032057.t1
MAVAPACAFAVSGAGGLPTQRRPVATTSSLTASARGRGAPAMWGGWRLRMAGRQPERGAAGRARVGGELAEELPAAVGAADAQEQWERLLALERRLRVAVELETYELAAKLRDGQAALCGEAPLRQRYILALVRKLRSASSTREELMEAVSELGEHGHSYDAVPELAAALHSAVGAGDKALTEAIIDAMWAIFTHSPNPAVTAKMKTGMDLMAAGSIPEAAEVFTEVIELEPSFAEGYNKRAMAFYVMQKPKESLADSRAVLQREPHHFGALAGMGLCLYKMGDLPAALDAFDRTTRVHPGLPGIRTLAEQIRAHLAG